jgi:hypothetical protein
VELILDVILERVDVMRRRDEGMVSKARQGNSKKLAITQAQE